MNTPPDEKKSTTFAEDKIKVRELKKNIVDKTKTYTLNRYFVVFSILIIVTTVVSWLLTRHLTRAPSPPPSPTINEANSPPVQQAAQSTPTPPEKQQKPPAPPPPKPPPKPDVYWSILGKQLLDLEKDRAQLINTFIETLHPEAETLSLSTVTPESSLEVVQTPLPQKPSPPANLSWHVIGQQLSTLEQQRQETVTTIIQKQQESQHE